MSIAADFLQKQQKQRGCAKMAAETSDFDRLLQLPQVPPGRRPLSPRMVWPHLRALQPEEEAPLQTRCRSSGPSHIGQPQAVDGPARLLALRTGGGNSILFLSAIRRRSKCKIAPKK
jgi:hypothetical protein